MTLHTVRSGAAADVVRTEMLDSARHGLVADVRQTPATDSAALQSSARAAAKRAAAVMSCQTGAFCRHPTLDPTRHAVRDAIRADGTNVKNFGSRRAWPFSLFDLARAAPSGRARSTLPKSEGSAQPMIVPKCRPRGLDEERALPTFFALEVRANVLFFRISTRACRVQLLGPRQRRVTPLSGCQQ